MQLVTTVLPALRQRGVIARYFSKKWSLTFHQPERTCKSLFLRTEFSGGNLPHARCQLPFVLAGTRFFSKRSPSIPKKRFSKRFFRKWRPSSGILPISVPAVVVPDVWPHVPVIGISNEAVFPTFFKDIEISNPALIDLICRKIKLNEPYVGVFLKKAKENEADIVQSLDDIYSIGTFARIYYIEEDLSNQKLNVSIKTHRRIKIIKQIVENYQPEQDERMTRSKYKRSVYRETENRVTEQSKRAEKVDKDANFTKVNSALLNVNDQTYKPLDALSSQLNREPVLMVEVVNVNDEYKQTEEIKAITQEINKTLSHITIATNDDIVFPIKQKRKRIHCSEDTFINDPVEVSYLGAYNSLVANAQELQEVLEEVDILKKLRLTLALVKKELNKVTDESALDITEKKCIQEDIYFLYVELEAIEKDLELVNIYRPIIENMSNE